MSGREGLNDTLNINERLTQPLKLPFESFSTVKLNQLTNPLEDKKAVASNSRTILRRDRRLDCNHKPIVDSVQKERTRDIE